jgi:hypothetical protein
MRYLVTKLLILTELQDLPWLAAGFNIPMLRMWHI